MKRSLLTPLAVSGLLLALTACGDDAASDADDAPADVAASVAANASTEVDVEGMLDSVDDSTLLGALGQGISGVLPGAGSYAVAGSTLTITMEGSVDADGETSCSIAGGAASALGVGEDTMLVLAFPDGDIVCEI